MEKDIVNYCLKHARSKKVEYAEASARYANNEALAFKNGVLDACSIMVDSGFGVRILANVGSGFTSSNKRIKKETKNLLFNLTCARQRSH